MFRKGLLLTVAVLCSAAAGLVWASTQTSMPDSALAAQAVEQVPGPKCCYLMKPCCPNGPCCPKK